VWRERRVSLPPPPPPPPPPPLSHSLSCPLSLSPLSPSLCCSGKGWAAYALRLTGFLISQLIFFSVFLPLFFLAVLRSGALFNCKGWAALHQHHWAGQGKGLIRRVLPLYATFFRRDFHPWQHDNSADIARETAHFAAAAEAVTKRSAGSSSSSSSSSAAGSSGSAKGPEAAGSASVRRR
jgi:hypothetical protein